MPEHDETDAPECDTICIICEQPDDHNHTADEVREYLRSQPNHVRTPKADRWGVEDKVVDGESK